MPSPYSLSRAKESVDHRLILQHDTFQKLLDGRLLNAPVPAHGAQVLDIGTGCGIWAAELAAAHPSATVLGMDNLPQPTIAAPRNCRFVAQDAEQPWHALVDGDAEFDIVHTRLVPLRAAHVPAVLRRCYAHVKPGGYVEMQELMPPFRTDAPAGAPEHGSKVLEWARLRKEAAAELGVDHGITSRLPEMLSDAGFEEVQTLDLKLPIGAWMDDEKMKDVGNTFLECMRPGKLELSQQLLTRLGMDERQIIDLVEQAGKELGVGRIYTMARFVWARKPVTLPATADC